MAIWARGFFRYVQSADTIRDLTVCGSVIPSDRKDSMGGLVGVNSEKLLNDSFQGNVKDGADVGGVAGLGKNVTDCRSLVEIDRGSAYLGAGGMEEDGEVSETTPLPTIP